MSVLVVFAGLPGSGKTAVARTVADRLGATFLRIDTIEAAVTSTLAPAAGNPVGYVVAEQVAADQLRAGRDVVIDAVNAVESARAGWRALGERFGLAPRFVEVVCSDAVEHRRRVESRGFEMSGHRQPSWAEVTAVRWEPFVDPRLRVDNVGPPDAAVEQVLAWL